MLSCEMDEICFSNISNDSTFEDISCFTDVYSSAEICGVINSNDKIKQLSSIFWMLFV